MSSDVILYPITHLACALHKARPNEASPAEVWGAWRAAVKAAADHLYKAYPEMDRGRFVGACRRGID
jgi:hypothetical protein